LKENDVRNRQIESWYEQCSVRTVNLILELGGTSLFFISGESLVLDLLVFNRNTFRDDQQVL